MNENNSMAVRHQYLDNLTGLLIVQMIFLCHVRIVAVGITDESLLYHLQYFLVFFMPWFFYKSGMFYIHKAPKEQLIKDARKFLLPFGLYALFAYIIQISCMSIWHEPFTIDRLFYEQIDDLFMNASVPWNQPLWFLMMLFIVKNSYNLLEPYVNKYVIIIMSLIIACFFRGINQYVNFWIGTTSQCLFFYAMGDILKSVQFKRLVFIVALFIYTLRYCFSLIHEWDARINYVSEVDNYTLTIIIILAGIILFNNIFKKFFDYDIIALNFIGKNSMLLYVSHFPCIMILYFYIMPFLSMKGTYAGFIISSFIMIFYLSFIYIIDRYIMKKQIHM